MRFLKLRHVRKSAGMAVLASLMLLTMACSKGFEAVGDFAKKASTGQSQCKIQDAQNSSANTMTEIMAVRSYESKVEPLTQTSNIIASLSASCMSANGMSSAWENTIELLSEPNFKMSDLAAVKLRLKPEMENVMSASELENILMAEPCVVRASDNGVARRFAMPNDSLLNLQTHIPAIGHNLQYDYFFDSATQIQSDVVIAIIDDGVNIDHVEFQNSLWINLAEANGQAGVDDDQNGYVDDINGFDFASNNGNPRPKGNSPHGTHVAGLAAANGNNGVGGIGVMSKHAKIMALNVFGEEDGAAFVDIENAIRYATANGANVINMSLGANARVPTLDVAIREAVAAGVLVVAAAGNDGVEMTANRFTSPAGYAKDIQGFIAVGASNAANASQICGFSTFSSTYVEIAAPGCDSGNAQGLVSTSFGQQYVRLNGTSMASPIVAGTAALIVGFDKDHPALNLTPAQVEAMIVESSTKLVGLNGRIKENASLDLRVLGPALATLFNPEMDNGGGTTQCP